MRRWNQAKGGIVLLALSLVGVMIGGFFIVQNRRAQREKHPADQVEEYINKRMELDTQLTQLQNQIRAQNAMVKGTLVLMFDQCAPNAYDVVYKQLLEFEMAGSLVFRDVLPGDEGAITVQQWSEMQAHGWTGVLGSNDELLSTAGRAGYTTRLKEHVKNMTDAFEARGMRAPTAYAFVEGECTEDTLKELRELGFVTFSAPDVDTTLLDDEGLLMRELYLSGDPYAPLLQSTVNGLANEADGVVIKTRYVMDGGDPSLDTHLVKFRAGMLSSIASYRFNKTICIETMDSALAAYKAEFEVYTATEEKKNELQRQIDAIQVQLDELWQKYR